MKAIIENKLYDTEKAKELCVYYEYSTEVNISGGWEEYILFKTRKGNYFNYEEEKGILPLTPEEAKKIIAKVDPDLYMKEYNDIEEA